MRELLRLRVKDIDFQKNRITVRQGKGDKDRVTMLPLSLKEPLRKHLVGVKQAHDVDLMEGFGNVELPYALEKKYPQAAMEWKWQYVFVAPKRSIDPRTKIERRHHPRLRCSVAGWSKPPNAWTNAARPKGIWFVSTAAPAKAGTRNSLRGRKPFRPTRFKSGACETAPIFINFRL